MITLGDHTYTGRYYEVFEPIVEVGGYCSLSDNIFFYGTANHRTDTVSTFPFVERGLHPNLKDTSTTYSKGPIIIKNDVWIGQGVAIMSGVTIGNGVVVGAYAVVAKNLDDYGIYVGNPARLVRYRFSEDIIEKLNSIKWWDWGVEKISANMDYFYGPIENFVEKFYEK